MCLWTGRAPAVAAANPQICANLASSHPSMRVSGHVSHGALGLFDSQPGGQGRAGLGLYKRYAKK